MAKERRPKYSRSASSDVKSEMHRYKRGKRKAAPEAAAERSRTASKR